jgi:hypothetical protein
VVDLRLTLLDEDDKPVWSYALPAGSAFVDWAAVGRDVRLVLEPGDSVYVPDDET